MMILNELIQQIYTLNESERFYKGYHDAKKSGEEVFNAYLKSLNKEECVRKHYIVPEILETMPPAMQDAYFLKPQDHGMVVQKHNCYTPPFEHSHNYYECAYVYEGTCEHEFFGFKQILRTGDFYIIPPGTKHSISIQDQSIVFNLIISIDTINNTFKNNIYYKNNILSNFFINNLHFNRDFNVLAFKTGNDEEIRQLVLKMVLESANKLPESDAITTGAFSILFGLLLRYYSHNSRLYTMEYKKQNMINKMLIYIQENYVDVSLQSLADHFHYSKEYISKYIKENTRSSFSDIVTASKLKAAESMLASTNASITDIAYQIGYENPENFIRVFKKKYGYTPSKFRKKLYEELEK